VRAQGAAPPARIDLSLEEAAIARECAYLESRARANGSGENDWPSDEAIAANLRQVEDASRAQAVAGWIERGFDAGDASAAVAACGGDAQAGLAFLTLCVQLQDEYGFPAEIVRSSLGSGDDIQTAVNKILQVSRGTSG